MNATGQCRAARRTHLTRATAAPERRACSTAGSASGDDRRPISCHSRSPRLAEAAGAGAAGVAGVAAAGVGAAAAAAAAAAAVAAAAGAVALLAWRLELGVSNPNPGTPDARLTHVLARGLLREQRNPVTAALAAIAAAAAGIASLAYTSAAAAAVATGIADIASAAIAAVAAAGAASAGVVNSAASVAAYAASSATAARTHQHEVNQQPTARNLPAALLRRRHAGRCEVIRQPGDVLVSRDCVPDVLGMSTHQAQQPRIFAAGVVDAASATAVRIATAAVVAAAAAAAAAPAACTAAAAAAKVIVAAGTAAAAADNAAAAAEVVVAVIAAASTGCTACAASTGCTACAASTGCTACAAHAAGPVAAAWPVLAAGKSAAAGGIPAAPAAVVLLQCHRQPPHPGVRERGARVLPHPQGTCRLPPNFLSQPAPFHEGGVPHDARRCGVRQSG
eukprot:366387-Chlamydomonas_euryale.AAC.4